jgi:LPS-assembly lipoprotein
MGRQPGLKAIWAAGLIAALPMLAACGFTPLYAQPGVSPAMAAIRVVTPDGRSGHLLSEDLQDDFAVNRRQEPLYQLNLAVDEIRYPRGLNVQQTATWYELQLRVSYSLTEIASGKTLTAGVAPVTVSYNAVDDPYGGIVAQQDGQKRAAAEASREIRLRVADYFAGRAQPSKP